MKNENEQKHVVIFEAIEDDSNINYYIWKEPMKTKGIMQSIAQKCLEVLFILK